MVLLSPYLGEDAIHKCIADAGGLARWQPDTHTDTGQVSSEDDWQRKQQQLWTFLHGWTTHPSRIDHVWLGYGDHDRLRGGIDLLAPALPRGHVLILPGGHSWKVWKSAARQLLRKIAISQDFASTP